MHNRLLKCDIIILQTFPFEHLYLDHHVTYTAAVRMSVQNFKSLALMKVKIEKFEVLRSPHQPYVGTLYVLESK